MVDAPIINGQSLISADGSYTFYYTIPNPGSGIIYYEAVKNTPKPVPDLEKLFSREPKPYTGYPGQGIGELISEGIEKIFGKRIPIPDPIPVPVPVPVPAPYPVPVKPIVPIP